MYTTGDKLLNVMKEEEIGIAELSRISGVPERTILDIMAGVKEPELGVMCKIAEGPGICVHELRADEERYAVSVQKDTLAGGGTQINTDKVIHGFFPFSEIPTPPR